MGYTPQQWSDLDPTKPASAARFSYMEGGIKGNSDRLDALDTGTGAGRLSDASLAAAFDVPVRRLMGPLLLPSYGVPQTSPIYRANTAATGDGNTGGTITKPAGVVASDALILAVETTGVLPTTPPGWTLEGQQTFASGASKVAIYSRVAALSEPASYILTFTSAVTWRAQLLAFAEGDSLDPVESVAFANIAVADTVFTAPSIPLPRIGWWQTLIIGEASLGTSALVASTPATWSKNLETNGVTGFQRPAGNSLPSGTQAFTRSGTDTGMAVSIGIRSREVTRYANSFASGDLTGFTPSLQNGPGNPTVITDPFAPAGSTRKVCQFDVLAGQTRQELVTGPGADGAGQRFVSGDDIYFATAYWLSPDWPVSVPAWQLLQQWLTPVPGLPDTAGIGISAGSWGNGQWTVVSVGPATGMPTDGTGIAEMHPMAPVKVATWTKVVTRVKFSEDPTQSLVQVWLGFGGGSLEMVFDSDNKKDEWAREGIYRTETRKGWWPSFTGETAGSAGGTLRTGTLGGYHKHGIYRDSALTSNARMLSAGVRWGTSLAEVLL